MGSFWGSVNENRGFDSVNGGGGVVGSVWMCRSEWRLCTFGPTSPEIRQTDCCWCRKISGGQTVSELCDIT